MVNRNKATCFISSRNKHTHTRQIGLINFLVNYSIMLYADDGTLGFGVGKLVYCSVGVRCAAMRVNENAYEKDDVIRAASG